MTQRLTVITFIKNLKTWGLWSLMLNPTLESICAIFNIVLFFATKIPINCSFHEMSCLFPGVISAPIGTFGATKLINSCSDFQLPSKASSLAYSLLHSYRCKHLHCCILPSLETSQPYITKTRPLLKTPDRRQEDGSYASSVNTPRPPPVVETKHTECALAKALREPSTEWTHNVVNTS